MANEALKRHKNSNAQEAGKQPHPYAYVILCGGVLVHLTLGSLYTWGNLNTYVISYMRDAGSAVRLKDSPTLHAAVLLGQATFMPFGGLLERRIGARRTAALGCFIMTASVAVASRVIHSFALFTLVYGVCNGAGIGIAYTSPLTCAMKWFPNNTGYATGIITAGFGVGALLLTQVQTRLINPSNIFPTGVGPAGSNERYFVHEGVLSNVPGTLATLAVLYAAVQIVGCMCLKDPEHAQTESKQFAVQDKTATDYSVGQAVREKRFWQIFICFLFNGLASSFIATFWKFFGCGINDMTLSQVGSIGSFFNALGRIVWGNICDRIGISRSLITMGLIWAVLMISFPRLCGYGPGCYTIGVSLLFFCLGGNYSLFPIATATAFGRSNLGPIYGTLYLSQLSASFGIVLLAGKMIPHIGVAGICVLCSFCCLLTTAIIFALHTSSSSFDKRVASK